MLERQINFRTLRKKRKKNTRQGQANDCEMCAIGLLLRTLASVWYYQCKVWQWKKKNMRNDMKLKTKLPMIFSNMLHTQVQVDRMTGFMVWFFLLVVYILCFDVLVASFSVRCDLNAPLHSHCVLSVLSL